MKAKYVLTLLAAIFLIAVPSGGVARAQEPAPPPSPDDFGNTFSFFVDGGGFLGVYGEDITCDNMAHYHLSEPRGVGITRVMNESPAQKAGLRQNDVILRFDGENVTSVRKLNRLVSEIAPDHTLTIMFGNSRRIGVSTVELTKQLAAYFGIADGKGVLVTNVADDGPAAKAGLKAGTVIR